MIWFFWLIWYFWWDKSEIIEDFKGVDMKENNKVLAQRFFRAVYGGDTSVIDELASAEIVMSYPVFERLFNSPVLQGREAVKAFAVGFSSRWDEVQITVHEALAEGDQVVLVWRFEARNVGRIQGREPDNEIHSWGGMTLYRFNHLGEIVAEIGEESTPGPIERLAMNGA